MADRSLETYTSVELGNMPSIDSGQWHELKVQEDVDGVPTRWWLSRMTVDDGETKAVYVEQYLDGRWQEVHAYGKPLRATHLRRIKNACCDLPTVS